MERMNIDQFKKEFPEYFAGKKKSKYGNKHVRLDGYTFDSELEAKYYEYLKYLKMSGEVKGFELQPEFELIPKQVDDNGKTLFRGTKYRADFEVEYSSGHKEVVDVKGFKTASYLIKRKMFLKKYPDTYFREIGKDEI